MDTKIDFKDPAYYENRELSWIKFDQRVLSEAREIHSAFGAVEICQYYLFQSG